jgi:cytosine/adenosine deaminase-related metal-dependent hydrolase
VIVSGRAVLLDGEHWLEAGGLRIEHGRVRAVLRSRAALRRASGRRLELEDAVLAPGLVNAHAHLELGALAGRVSARGGFVAWVGALLAARARLTPAALARGVREGARALLASGTTALGDIDSSGTSTRLARTLGLRVVVYREVLDAWDPTRLAAAVALAGAHRPLGALVRAGLSPHAPYTTSSALLAAVRRAALRRALPLAAHWAETREEQEWLARGAGPLARLLPDSPRRSGLALLDAAGLVGPRTALVHANHPRPGELELVARRGASVVHCPGTHAFFARAPFPLARLRAAGVELALGTDSLASNVELDLRAEMAALRARFPRLAPAEVFAMATTGGARALGLAGGKLAPGAPADVVGWRLAARSRREALDELTAGRPAVTASLVAGRVRFRG